MKYGQIAGSKKVNYAIYRCFEHLCEKDQQSFVTKFREQPPDSDQIMHTFRELILGAYLSSRGFEVRHEYSVESKTPDWCILDNRAAVISIVDLVNFHIDQETERELKEQERVKSIVTPYWRDGKKDNVQRLYNSLRNKITKYQTLVRRLRVPYVVAIFPDFRVVVDFEEVQQCLYNESGLFNLYSELSGVLFFEENGGRYHFKYAKNLNALCQFDLPSGIMDLSGR